MPDADDCAFQIRLSIGKENAVFLLYFFEYYRTASVLRHFQYGQSIRGRLGKNFKTHITDAFTYVLRHLFVLLEIFFDPCCDDQFETFFQSTEDRDCWGEGCLVLDSEFLIDFNIEIVSGKTSPVKTLRVCGVNPTMIETLLT